MRRRSKIKVARRKRARDEEEDDVVIEPTSKVLPRELWIMLFYKCHHVLDAISLLLCTPGGKNTLFTHQELYRIYYSTKTAHYRFLAMESLPMHLKANRLMWTKLGIREAPYFDNGDEEQAEIVSHAPEVYLHSMIPILKSSQLPPIWITRLVSMFKFPPGSLVVDVTFLQDADEETQLAVCRNIPTALRSLNRPVSYEMCLQAAEGGGRGLVEHDFRHLSHEHRMMVIETTLKHRPGFINEFSDDTWYHKILYKRVFPENFEAFKAAKNKTAHMCKIAIRVDPLRALSFIRCPTLYAWRYALYTQSKHGFPSSPAHENWCNNFRALLKSSPHKVEMTLDLDVYETTRVRMTKPNAFSDHLANYDDVEEENE